MALSSAFVSLLLAALLATRASACSCFPTGFETAFYRAEKSDQPITLAKVLWTYERSGSIGSGPFVSQIRERVYVLQVLKEYSGCPRPVRYAIATSPVSSATCGVFLKNGVTYLLPLRRDLKESPIGLCGVAIEQSRISTTVQKFLDSRDRCCKGSCKCVHTDRVACIVSPCSRAKKPCAEAEKCVDNYCGGCNAEWFTKDMLPACAPSPFGRPLPPVVEGSSAAE